MRDEWKEKLRKVKLIITIIIIAGVIIHLFLVYEAAKSLEITGKKITGLYPTYRKIDEYEVKFALTFKNPKSTPIEVEYLHYKVYIEDEFVGEGSKPQFRIEKGVSNHTFSLTFSALNLTASTKNLLLYGSVNVTVKGETIVPAKFLGIFTWKYIKIPYTIHDRISISL